MSSLMLVAIILMVAAVVLAVCGVMMMVRDRGERRLSPQPPDQAPLTDETVAAPEPVPSLGPSLDHQPVTPADKAQGLGWMKASELAEDRK